MSTKHVTANGVNISIEQTTWAGMDCWAVVSPSYGGRNPKFLTPDGAWVACFGAGIQPIFPTLEAAEDAITVGVLTDWQGTEPNPPFVTWGKSILKMTKLAVRQIS